VKNRILDAAADDLNKRGTKFTIDAVAARVGISKKTLYQYYASKDALITAITDAIIADMVRQRTAILASNAPLPEKIIKFLTIRPTTIGPISDWVIEDFRRFKPQEWDKIEEFRRQHVDFLAQLMADGQQNGHVRQVDCCVAAKMLYGAITELLNTRFLKDRDLTLQQAMANVTDIFLHGILKVRSEQTR
jgi:AcrR family transcriptional regulator